MPAAQAADSIYWTYVFGSRVSVASLAGGSGADLDTTGATTNGPRGVAFDLQTGRIYWPNEFGNKISFANVDEVKAHRADPEKAEAELH